MVRLLVGHKGSGKTKQMLALANDLVDKCDGHVLFINKNEDLMYELNHAIRNVCMEEYPHITNSDEYIGFIYGIISSDHDIDTMFIDGILRYADVSLGNLPEFIERLKLISDDFGIDFTVSLSAEKEELIGVDFSNCEILN
jgi:energy-coupling factor transporter ATP-binding protein EcfA2